MNRNILDIHYDPTTGDLDAIDLDVDEDEDPDDVHELNFDDPDAVCLDADGCVLQDQTGRVFCEECGIDSDEDEDFDFGLGLCSSCAVAGGADTTLADIVG